MARTAAKVAINDLFYQGKCNKKILKKIYLYILFKLAENITNGEFTETPTNYRS